MEGGAQYSMATLPPPSWLVRQVLNLSLVSLLLAQYFRRRQSEVCTWAAMTHDISGRSSQSRHVSSVPEI